MVKEKRMRSIVSNYFKSKGYNCIFEVPILDRKVDIIAFRENELISVELKVQDWKRALEQALTCKIWSDYVYIAFWHEFLPKDLSIFETYKIGIISTGLKNTEEKLKPSVSKLIHKSLYSKIKENVEFGSHLSY